MRIGREGHLGGAEAACVGSGMGNTSLAKGAGVVVGELEPEGRNNISPETKISATEKRQYTRAINAGKSEAEAKKIGAAAGKALAAKLGGK